MERPNPPQSDEKSPPSPPSAPPPPATAIPPVKVWPIIVLLLRILTFVILLVSFVILAAASVSITGEDGRDTTFNFQDFYAYRYALSISVIGCAYVLPQIGIAVYQITMGSHFSEGLQKVIMYTDMVFALLFSSAIGAGFGFMVDTKRTYDGFNNKIEDGNFEYLILSASVLNDIQTKMDKFFGMANTSSSFLILATILTAVCIYAALNKK